MGQETNAESRRTLEKQIGNGEGNIIELKRARNSLLNISTLIPPEILGEVFSWILFRPDPVLDVDSCFNRFCEGSYNFLVCHHWFQVASHTPTLRTFCGNALQHWKKRLHLHPQATPLPDLILNDRSSGVTLSIDHTVQDALRDLATRDAIRQVHLRCRSRDLLSQLISFLTPKGEGVQWRSIESIDLEQPWGVSPFDVSNFFTRVRLPKLRCLTIHGPLIYCLGPPRKTGHGSDHPIPPHLHNLPISTFNHLPAVFISHSKSWLASTFPGCLCDSRRRRKWVHVPSTIATPEGALLGLQTSTCHQNIGTSRISLPIEIPQGFRFPFRDRKRVTNLRVVCTTLLREQPPSLGQAQA